MIRFMPDTWQDALLRPLAMAAPNGWVYTEITAPDVRFALALLLAIPALVVLFRRRFRDEADRPLLSLLALTFLSFVPWLLTTGNGRYLMPYILLIGPLCIGLIRAIPGTASMRLSLVGLVLAFQGISLAQNNPWNPFDTWESIAWKKPPYFSVDFGGNPPAPNTTYVTIGTNSLALVAPRFPETSRWINLSVFNGADISGDSKEYRPVVEMLQSSRSLKLVQRSNPRAMNRSDDQPDERAVHEINAQLAPHRLALRQPTDCRLHFSESLATTAMLSTDESPEEKRRIKAKLGLWICTLDYPVAPKLVPELTSGELLAKNVIERMERLCPRFFPPGQALILQHSAGFARNYAQSDSSLIVTRDGKLYVKNARALNPESIGSVAEIMKPGFEFDCTKFKGRSGLPWEREV